MHDRRRPRNLHPSRRTRCGDFDPERLREWPVRNALCSSGMWWTKNGSGPQNKGEAPTRYSGFDFSKHSGKLPEYSAWMNRSSFSNPPYSGRIAQGGLFEPRLQLLESGAKLPFHARRIRSKSRIPNHTPDTA
jgi:hypothetical protein